MREAEVPGEAFVACWRDRPAIVNLRGRPEDPGFLEATRAVLGVAPPIEPCTTVEAAGLHLVWAGPDDWFVIGPPGATEGLTAGLRKALSGLHAAVNDVGGGYRVLRLSGPAACDVLSRGCPLDLHPRTFGPGRCAGSHFFKASVWLWRTGDGRSLDMLVRRSFAGYLGLMLERSARNCGLAFERPRAD